MSNPDVQVWLEKKCAEIKAGLRQLDRDELSERELRFVRAAEQTVETFLAESSIACERETVEIIDGRARTVPACDFVGHLSSFLPNASSVFNAIRCPKCGSTRNAYNREHSRRMSKAIARTRKDRT